MLPFDTGGWAEAMLPEPRRDNAQFCPVLLGLSCADLSPASAFADGRPQAGGLFQSSLSPGAVLAR